MNRLLDTLHAASKLTVTIEALLTFHRTSRGSDTLQLLDKVMNLINEAANNVPKVERRHHHEPIGH